MTDLEGHFSIPGVLPGNYRLSARPDLGSATINIPHRDITVGTEPLDLGELTPESHPFLLEIDHRVEMPADLPERLRTAAVKHSSQPIERIWIGEVTHPTGNYGARVTFAPTPDEKDPTRATRQMLIVEIPGESIRKFYPAHDSLGYGFRYSDAPFLDERLLTSEIRRFPLENQTLFLPLEDNTLYDSALALLSAIEAGEIKKPDKAPHHPKSPPRPIRQTRPTCPISQIIDIHKIADGTFESTGGGGWIS
jgi:hypothetical protein